MSRLLGDLPRLFPRPEQTIAGIGQLLRNGEVTCVDILNACLEQVEEWEPKVHAWVRLDRDGAMELARALDDEIRSGQDRGPLHGIPIGIKDIIDVQGMSTACGSKRWVDRIAKKDAIIVELLRGAGAVIMGKTVTTPYAWIDPPPTRNPWNLERTPGGSSSGSAAAVACGMCFGAIGTQTGGSITRPASFCGVAGMKPGLVEVSTEGVHPFAPSLDSVGPIARSVRDLRSLYEVIWSYSADYKRRFADPPREDRPIRLVRLRGFFDRRLDTSLRPIVDDALRALVDRGAEVTEIDDPVDFEKTLVQHRTVMAAEAAATHSADLDEFPQDYPPRIRDLIEEGRSVPAPAYIKARDALWACREVFEVRFDPGREFDAFVTPATVGTAPDLSTTGDPSFNSPWSYFHLPTVSFPIGRAKDQLPFAIQFVGAGPSSTWLLTTAELCEDAIRTWQQ
jgi:Asp-tRNA(Asn)/Glu-tRNA(Gln) amidotransferase A subunit family amidase